MTAKDATTAPWPDLPPDLLFDVSRRLHDAADFVRFHAVCKPWRDSEPLSRPVLMPWLLAPCQGRILHSAVKFGRAVSSRDKEPIGSDESIVLAAPPDNQNFVISHDGTGAWLLTTVNPEPELLDLATGAVTPLPRISALLENPRGIVYGDGTVFVYSFNEERRRDIAFTAAILGPGDAAWKLVKQRLGFVTTHSCSVAAYNDAMPRSYSAAACTSRSCILAPDDDGGSYGLRPRWDRSEVRQHDCDYSYLLESRGELLLASVLVEHGEGRRCCYRRGDDALPPPGLSVSVHALEAEDGKMMMRWVPRYGGSLGDRVVLFLGSPVSFAADAARIGMAGGGGGCACFVYKRRVFRYSLVVGRGTMKRRLPRGLGAGRAHVWLQPRPAIAPIQEIAERLDVRTEQEATNSAISFLSRVICSNPLSSLLSTRDPDDAFTGADH